MFLGEYEYRLDQKGRVAIPPKARGDFSDGIVVTRGYDNCIVAYTTTTWDRLAEEYASLPGTDRGARLVNRLVFSSAFRLTLDRLGRLGLPTPLREYAQIDEEVVVAGVGSHLEIWGKEALGPGTGVDGREGLRDSPGTDRRALGEPSSASF